MNALIFYLLLAFLAFSWLRSTLLAFGVTIVCCLVVLAVGVSRVYLGVHYPTDVMAGYIVGFWWLLACVALHRALMAYRSFVPGRPPARLA